MEVHKYTHFRIFSALKGPCSRLDSSSAANLLLELASGVGLNTELNIHKHSPIRRAASAPSRREFALKSVGFGVIRGAELCTCTTPQTRVCTPNWPLKN